jgi:hypothetical protein
MSRPTSMKVDGTVYWTLMTYDADGILVDADSTPTVAVRKNGASVADAVTVTKRSATTGIYDCSHNPAGEAEGDTFGYEESVAISSQAYLNPWSLEVEAVEAGGGGGGGDATAANQTTIINAISGLNDFNPATDPVANVTLVGTTTTNTDMRGTDGANTVAPVDVSSDVTAILADTNELQLNQNNWLTATGFSTFDASTDTVTTDTASRDASKADVSGLSTFDASTDQVVASNMRGTDGANTIAPVDVSSDVTAILADTNELQLNQGNWLTATGFNTVAPDNASITAILADTNELQGNQADWATATGFATPADLTAALSPVVTSIGNLNDFDPALDVVAHVTLVDTTTDLTNQSGGGGGSSASDIYDYFTDGTREDAFKADTSGLSTFDPASDTVARVTLVDTTTDLTNQTAGGVGMFQASVRVQDSSGNALQGARINVDGTTLSLTTGVSGEVVFNLDSGVYLLNLLPPADYDTPTGQVLTITASDPAQTVFSLTSTSPPDGCDVTWIG